MTGKMGSEMVAEGVEKREHLDFLLAIYYTRTLGFFSNTLPVDAWLASVECAH